MFTEKTIQIILLAILSCFYLGKAQAESDMQPLIAQITSKLDTKCSTQYDKDKIQQMINELSESQRALYRVSFDIRVYAECQCLPEKLKTLNLKEFDGMDKDQQLQLLQNKLKDISVNCGVTGMRKNWTAFCGVIMQSETDDQAKISQACQCMKQSLDTVSNEELAQISTRAYRKYQQNAKGEIVEKQEKSNLERSMEACSQKAGIDPNSEYKKQYAMQRREENRVKLANSNLQTIAIALSLYKLDNDRYPEQEKGLDILLKPSRKSAFNKSAPVYLKDLPVDPWGKPYVYQVSDNGLNFELFSYGRDGKPGGQGFDQDIYHQK